MHYKSKKVYNSCEETLAIISTKEQYFIAVKIKFDIVVCHEKLIDTLYVSLTVQLIHYKSK